MLMTDQQLDHWLQALISFTDSTSTLDVRPLVLLIELELIKFKPPGI